LGDYFGAFQPVYSDVKSFVSLGAKNYCVVNGNSSTIKVSGLTLNTLLTADIITPETFQQCLKGVQKPIAVPQSRTSATQKYETKKRKINVTFSALPHLKRKLLKDSVFTVPYGYNDQ
jgi:hypothetical protein